MKKTLSIISILCFTLIFTGCSTNSDSTAEQTTDKSTVLSSKISPNQNYSDGDSIQIQINDNVKIDANLTVPDALQPMEMKKVKAHRPNLDEEKIKKLFIDTNHIKSREVYDGFKCREFGQYAIVNYTGKQGEQLFYEPSNVEYSHPNIDYILNCLFTDPQFSSYNLDLYSQTENLSFASKKEIFHKVKMMFASLDVPVSEQYTCYALNHETLQKEEKPMDSAGNRVEKAKKQKWTKEDDAYYFVLHQEINGIPITQLPYGDGYEGTGIELTELSAIYGKRGWISFTENWGYNLEETEEKQKILSAEEILHSFQKKCDMLLLDQHWVIQDISLQLLPVFIKDNDYEIHPVWFFEGSATDKDQIERPLTILFDGITGKEITT